MGNAEGRVSTLLSWNYLDNCVSGATTRAGSPPPRAPHTFHAEQRRRLGKAPGGSYWRVAARAALRALAGERDGL